MGGYLTLRSMVISHDIKVGVIWAGVVGDYEDLLYNWRQARRSYTHPPTGRPQLAIELGRNLWLARTKPRLLGLCLYQIATSRTSPAQYNCIMAQPMKAYRWRFRNAIHAAARRGKDGGAVHIPRR